MNAVVDARNLDMAADLRAEQSVLGILLRNSTLIDIAENLRPEHFFLRPHQIIYESIERISLADKQADPIAVYDDLRRRGVADEIEGRDQLFALRDQAGGEQSLETHAEIVRERALLRSVRLAAARARDIAINTTGKSAADILESAMGEFSKLSDNYSRKDPVPIYSVFKDYVEKLDRIVHGEEVATGLSTGIDDLDYALNGGLKPGKLYIVGARPSMGKTALVLNWAAFQSVEGASVGFFSLEMSREELMQRLIGIWGGVKTANLARGDIKSCGEFFKERMIVVAEKVEKAKLHLDDESHVSVADVTHKARSLKRKHGLDVLYVDYLQLMYGPEEKRHEMVGAITRGLKRLAKALGIPVVALSQLSRKVQDRPNRRPELSDLKESGDIEQDADVVLMPYREAMDKDNPQYPKLCELFIRKQRDGGLGCVDLDFQSEFTRFVPFSGPNSADRERMRASSHQKKTRGFMD